MDKTLMKQHIEAYVDAYNRFDVDGMLSTLHKAVRFENVVGGDVTLSTAGIDEFREVAEGAKQAFEQRQQTVLYIAFDDTAATAQIDYEGVLAVDLSDDLKAGDTIRLQGKSVYCFADGKIIYLADYS